MKVMALIALFALSLPCQASADSVKLHAAGSLKAALDEVATSYQKAYGTAVSAKYGPSGLLRKAIEGGETADVFASADMDHPGKLAAAGWGGPVTLFTRNRLCALAQPEVKVSSDTLLEVLLDGKIRVGTATPKADPSGDYAWQLFKKAEAVKKGSFATLSQKALQLTGGPTSEKAPKDRNQYGWVMAGKKADIFLTYCTNAVLAQKEVPGLKIVAIPETLSVAADYGLIVRKNAPEEARKLTLYIRSTEGQTILQRYGFETVAMPK